MIPNLFISFAKGVLADVLLVLFLEMEKNNIWRLNASDAKSYEWNSEKLYFLILYLVHKKTIFGNEPFSFTLLAPLGALIAIPTY